MLSTWSLLEGPSLEHFYPASRAKKQSCANWRSLLLIIAPVCVRLERLSRGHVGEALREPQLLRDQPEWTAVWNYREGKSSCVTNNNHRMIEYSRATRRKKLRPNTDAHDELTSWFQPCVDRNGESPVWSHPAAWKAEVLRVKVRWGLKVMNTGTNSPLSSYLENVGWAEQPWNKLPGCA